MLQCFKALLQAQQQSKQMLLKLFGIAQKVQELLKTFLNLILF